MNFDFVKVCSEWPLRQLRWRWPGTVIYDKFHKNSSPVPLILTKRYLEKTFESASLKRDDTLLVHATTTNVSLDDNGKIIDCLLGVATTLNKWLVDIAGESVTIVMPTYPNYKRQTNASESLKGVKLVYNPQKTASRTGALSEFFRRTPGCLRSPLPLQSLAAKGPLAEEIIQPGVFYSEIPPHGFDSPHYRLSMLNALVIGIGIPLHRYLTLVHVAEDLNFNRLKNGNFYRRRSFEVICDKKFETVMWERRPEFARVFCSLRFQRDILNEGILHESKDLESCDWLRSKNLLNFMSLKSNKSNYPYFMPCLARPFKDE